MTFALLSVLEKNWVQRYVSHYSCVSLSFYFLWTWHKQYLWNQWEPLALLYRMWWRKLKFIFINTWVNESCFAKMTHFISWKGRDLWDICSEKIIWWLRNYRWHMWSLCPGRHLLSPPSSTLPTIENCVFWEQIKLKEKCLRGY